MVNNVEPNRALSGTGKMMAKTARSAMMNGGIPARVWRQQEIGVTKTGQPES